MIAGLLPQLSVVASQPQRDQGQAWLLVTLAGLLLTSGFFSGSETALFSLTTEQRRASTGSVQRLLERPQPLLVTILLSNLVVNLLFFAFVDRLARRADGGLQELGFALGGLVALVVGGEIVPKTLALRARTRFARWAAPPLLFLNVPLGWLAAPALAVLARLHLFVDRRLAPETSVTPESLAQVLNRGAEEGLLVGEEADLLAEIVELHQVRVREIMTPRVDALFLRADGSDREGVIERAVALRQSWLPVIEEGPDHVLGRVRVRELLREPELSIRALVMPVEFVPEVATALDLLRTLQEDRTTEAVVVDEWGGTAGYVTAEQVFEEIVGDLRSEGERRVPAVVPLGENRFRIAGGLSIRDWNDAFGLRVVPVEFETVAGLVTARLGRIPRVGDVVRVENLILEVSEVRGRRVLTVDIGVASEKQAGSREPAAAAFVRREGDR